MGMGQNLVPLVNLKIAGKWMFIPLKMVLIGIDPYPYKYIYISVLTCCSVSSSIEMDEGSCRPGFARIHCGEGPSACT